MGHRHKVEEFSRGRSLRRALFLLSQRKELPMYAAVRQYEASRMMTKRHASFATASCHSSKRCRDASPTHGPRQPKEKAALLHSGCSRTRPEIESELIGVPGANDRLQSPTATRPRSEVSCP